MNEFCFRNEKTMKTERTEIKEQQTYRQHSNRRGQTPFGSRRVIKRDINLDAADTASTREPEAEGTVDESFDVSICKKSI